MAELTQRRQQAEQQLQQTEARRSSLNSEVKDLRAQLKRSQRTSDAAESSASGAAAELASYRADLQARISTDSEGARFTKLTSAMSTAELLEFELARAELERQILIDELTSSFDMPEARLYDASRHEFMGRARLVCIGCVKRGVAAKGLQELSMSLCMCCACAVHVLCMCCACAAMRRRTALDSHERSRVDTAVRSDVPVLCTRMCSACAVHVLCMC